jgi:cellulose biosynthesis protein BcsQ
MVTIVFYVRKGGAGKSTLSYIMACTAARAGRKVLLVGLDPQGDAVRWASGKDRPLRRDDFVESPYGFLAVFSPGRMPAIPSGIDLVLVDCPPEPDQAVPLVRPALWVVALDGRAALIDTMPVIPAMKAQGGNILFLLNKADAGGTRVEDALREAASKVPDTNIWREGVPFSGALDRVAEYGAPPWDVPYGKDSEGWVVLERFFNAILEIIVKAEADAMQGTTRKPVPAKPVPTSRGTNKPRKTR